MMGPLRNWNARDELYYIETFDRALALLGEPLERRWREAAELTERIDSHLSYDTDLAEFLSELARIVEKQLLDAPQEDVERNLANSIASLLPPYPVSAMVMPNFAGIFEREAAYKARCDLARTAAAIEQWRMEHAHWPDSLEQLVPEFLDAVPRDPFSSGTVRYRKTDTGVVVYAIGRDGRDNDGLGAGCAAAMAGTGSLPEGWQVGDADIPFRLLDPERRGAGELALREEVGVMRGVTLEHLQGIGYTEERLKSLGFTNDELQELRGRGE